FMDIVEIDAASNNGVDDIREMREKVKYLPVEGKYKVYIIDEVHMLSGAAFNAFLKTLEEPPPRVVFVLATTDPQKVPATILSRCQCFEFHSIPRKVLVERLSEVVQRERTTDPGFPAVGQETLQLLAESASGGFRDALSLLDQVASANNGGEVSVEQVLQLTRRVGHTTLRKLAGVLFEGDVASVLRQLHELFFRGYEVQSLGKDLLEWLRRAVFLHVDPQANQVLELPAEQAKDTLQLVQPLPLEYLMSVTSHLERAMTALRHSVHPRLLFELELVRLARREVSLGLEGTERRLSQVEQQLRTPRLVARPVGAAPTVVGTAEPGLRRADAAAPMRPLPVKTETAVRSQPARPYEAQPKPNLTLVKREPVAGSPEHLSPTERWAAFRQEILTCSTSTGSILEMARYEGFKDGVVTIVFGNDFSARRFREPSVLESIQPILEQFFGSGTRLDVRGATSPSPVAVKESVTQVKENIAKIDQSVKDKILSQSTVTDTLAVFGGEIVGIEKK
ncbi:MAG TPA: DNA polymerase III subunit gamma/tau, partial [Candidatus Ozemobacteraceae bacterium]|nr:DNA polymerase III subunit gamma/tau [Candidatus Ozemobacteraceae bacterium]